jgi:PhzF family phenazine biosynthesis protein
MRLFQVDAFTDTPFKGNPAAVCLLDTPQPDDWLQAVAGEMNLSETAFLRPRGDRYELRWFTPTMEVELCGHATLASAHVLWETGACRADRAVAFETRSGTLRARRAGDWIELDFPATPEREASCNIDLERALGAAPAYVGKSKFDFLVEMAGEQAVRDLAPDLVLLQQAQARGVIVTARADGGDHDFVSRFFAPQSGVPEDPVTGSAHCCLAPFWGRRLGKQEMVGFQASARGGIVRVRLQNDRVTLGGRAVTVLDAGLRCGGR